MKTCPWNLEGIFAEQPFRWLATHAPSLAPVLQRVDDALGRGSINPVKRWWWDIELGPEGGFVPATAPVNRRGIAPALKLRAADQTLAVYPAPLTPPPWPWPAPMDREAGIAAQRSMVSAVDHRAARARGDDSVLHRLPDHGAAPILRLVIASAEMVAPDLLAVCFRDPDGAALPEWTAGAHVDVLVAPEYQRSYSLCGNPSDRSEYRIAILRERAGSGGSDLAHRVFRPGRTVTLSQPRNHFPLTEDAPHTVLLGGGIGITPMLAFAHRLSRIGAPFDLHYSVRTRSAAGLLPDLSVFENTGRAHLHVSDEGSRLDMPALMKALPHGAHLYVCGPADYIAAASAAAKDAGIDEDLVHSEYFAAPTSPPRENHAFTLRLKDGTRISVPADRSAADALIDAGRPVPLKCSDGICGICRCGVVSGEVDHRDHVLSRAERQKEMILCQSRAVAAEGEIELDL